MTLSDKLKELRKNKLVIANVVFVLIMTGYCIGLYMGVELGEQRVKIKRINDFAAGFIQGMLTQPTFYNTSQGELLPEQYTINKTIIRDYDILLVFTSKSGKEINKSVTYDFTI